VQKILLGKLKVIQIRTPHGLLQWRRRELLLIQNSLVAGEMLEAAGVRQNVKLEVWMMTIRIAIGIQPRFLERNLLVGTVSKSQIMKLHPLDGVMAMVLKLAQVKETSILVGVGGSLEQVESKLEILLVLHVSMLVRMLDGAINQIRKGASHLVGEQKAIGMLQYLHHMIKRKKVKIKVVGVQEILQMVRLQGLVKLFVATRNLVLVL